MADMPTAGGTAKSAGARRHGITITPKMIAIGIILILAIWFIVANRQTARIHLWVPTVTAPMWLVLTITFAGGLLAGLLIRRGRKKQDAGTRTQ